MDLRLHITGLRTVRLWRQWFIRRTAGVVKESRQWPLWHEAQAMWSALLTGQVR
ncbi:hypothetical protein [Nonomuraea sp. NPDC049750]|uniref:hypothetical protein n=1 Tax=Nonomuraea sp. NPDC049750 TaxID=3154738 RepID=UPI003405DE53